jgi:serine/threonine protein kinase
VTYELSNSSADLLDANEEVKNIEVTYDDEKAEYYLNIKQKDTISKPSSQNSQPSYYPITKQIKNIERRIKSSSPSNTFWGTFKLTPSSSSLTSQLSPLTMILPKASLDNMWLLSPSANLSAFYWGREVFLKAFLVATEEDTKRLIEEVEFYAGSKHIGVVSLVGVYLFLYPQVYLVYEFYSMETLKDVYATMEKVDNKLKGQIVMQLLHSLEYIEQRGYTLAMIDPTNVLVTKNQIEYVKEGIPCAKNVYKEIKLWGFSNFVKIEDGYPAKISDKILENLNNCKIWAPELYLEQKLYDTSLIFSVGVWMVMIFTGGELFPEISNVQYIQKLYTQGIELMLLLGENVEFWDEESTTLNIESFSEKLPFKTVVQKAWNFDPAKRMKIARLIQFFKKKQYS